jgi:hypothetical protein
MTIITPRFWHYGSAKQQISTQERHIMESIEIRKVTNGYIVVVNDQDESREYIFDTHRRVVKFVKECFDAVGDKQKI